jgi:hypothetical protein
VEILIHQMPTMQVDLNRIVWVGHWQKRLAEWRLLQKFFREGDKDYQLSRVISSMKMLIPLVLVNKEENRLTSTSFVTLLSIRILCKNSWME